MTAEQGQERIDAMLAVEQLLTTPTLMASAKEEIVMSLGEVYARPHATQQHRGGTDTMHGALPNGHREKATAKMQGRYRQDDG